MEIILRNLKKYQYILGIIITCVASYWFFESISNSNQMLLNDLTESVSGRVKSVAVCKVFSNEIPKECAYMSEDSKNNFVKYIHQAKKAFPLNHPKSINTYLIRIISIVGAENLERKNCFLVDEIEGVKDLYFSRINSGENCSSNSFKYIGGSVSTFNFLTTPPINKNR
jgi:hypothetical protein